MNDPTVTNAHRDRIEILAKARATADYKERPCLLCGAVFKPTHSQMKCCSESCRFWINVGVSADPDACWPWTKYIGEHGYGTLTGDGQRGGMLTHRFAYRVVNGEIPEGMLVCHRCDNRPCCNPNHLFVGTYMDNVVDMKQKGRERKSHGEDHSKAILTEKEVRQIRLLRDMGLTITKISEIVEHPFGRVRAVFNNVTWKHVS